MTDAPKNGTEDLKGKHYLEVWPRLTLENLMGKILDLAKISDMGDRALDQFQKTVKKHFYDLIAYTITDFKERGYIPADADETKTWPGEDLKK